MFTIKSARPKIKEMFSTFVAAETKKKAVVQKKKAVKPKNYTFKIIKLEKCLSDLEALLTAQTTTEESKTDSDLSDSDLLGIVKLSLKYLKGCKYYADLVLKLIFFEFKLDQTTTERKPNSKKIINRIISHIGKANIADKADKADIADKADKADKSPNNIKFFSQLLEHIANLIYIYKFRPNGPNPPPYEEALLKIQRTEEYLLFYIKRIHTLFTNESFQKLPKVKNSKQVINKIITHSDITNVKKWKYPTNWTTLINKINGH
jgi:hypothetical protein